MNEVLDCPLRPEIEHLQDLNRDLIRSMRRLRRKLRYCQECVQGASCPLLAQFNKDVRLAVAKVAEEWNLVELYDFSGGKHG